MLALAIAVALGATDVSWTDHSGRCPASQGRVAIEAAAEGIAVAGYFNAGQDCTAATRAIVAADLYDDFVAGVGELVEDGINGFLVPPGDVESLAARIRTLAGDPDLRRCMGETGRARVVADFDISVEAARLAQLFLDPETRTATPRRKLKATHVERSVFGEGDGSDFSAFAEDEAGRLLGFALTGGCVRRKVELARAAPPLLP